MSSKKFETFFALDGTGSLIDYINSIPTLAQKIGHKNAEELEVKEVGDGNLNFVYIISGPKGSFVLKQAVPYIRCLGESWPMTKDRAYFEASILKEHGQLCPNHVPEVYHFDSTMAIIAMRYVEPPHIILRKGLIAGIEYPYLAEHISDYISKTLFHTSLLYLSTKEHKAAVARFCNNVEMCRLTEQVVFSDPYMISPISRWTTPYLDEDVKAVREDNQLKLEIAELKSKFCERTQALIHGDLHTGSIMVTSDSTQVIDPEFGFYGPMGFDIGAFLGNLILAYFAQDGHSGYANEREGYKHWILRCIQETWNLFESKFIALWNNNTEHCGDAYLEAVYNTPELKLIAQQKYMKDLFHDSLGFGAAKMIRRIVGVAHVEDFESIQDASKRAECERRALNIAKKIMKERRNFDTISQVAQAIQGK